MDGWETSNQTDVNTTTDGDAFDSFAEAFADLDAGDQRGEGEQTEAAVQDGAGDQRVGEQEAEPENEAPAAEEQQAPEPETVTLKSGDYTANLPAEAVRQLGAVLGADPIALLQKGMNYDSKADRELRLLGEYAEAAGLSLPQYVEQLERNRDETLMQAEMEKLRAEFPETPDGALAEIAKGRLSAARMQRQQAEMQRRQEMDAVQQRIAQTLAATKEEKQRREMLELVKLSGNLEPKDMPPRVFELIDAGANPVAAWWQHKAEEAQAAVQAAQKQQTNRAQSPGSMAGSGADMSDPFLAGFYSDY